MIPQVAKHGAYPVVVFDLDGTLLRETTVSLMLARWLGQEAEMAELEEAFSARQISHSDVADASASWLAGQSTADACRVLAKGAWIAGMSETFRALRATGASLLLGTITCSFAAEWLSDRYGFAAFSGTQLQASNGILSGSVGRYCDEHDKARFVQQWCQRNRVTMDQVAAVGDSRSDIPLFRCVGTSIALNATPDARSVATHVLNTDDLCDVLPLLDPADTAESRLQQYPI